MADISTAVSMARVPILGENGRISDDYIPAAIGENVTKAESAATRAETAAAGAEGSASAASQSAASVADKFISSAQATTLEPGSQATASVENQVLTIGVPKGEKGEKGDKGDQGEKGDTGTGVPEGGEPGQLLSKTDSGTAWVDPPSGNVLKGTLGPAPVLTADDAYATKPRKLTVHGATRQNLWVNPSGTSSGVTVTANEDGSITLSGTPTSSNQVNISTYALRPGSTYTVSKDVETTGVHFRIQSYDSDGSFLRNEVDATGWGNVKTFTLHDDAAYVRFGISAAVGQSASDTYRVMLNEGSTAEPWCPPGLNGVDELSVVCAGKNLLNEDAPTVDGVVGPQLPPGDYTLSGTLPSGASLKLLNGGADGETITDASSLPHSFTAGHPFTPYYAGVGGYATDLMLELGSTATAYEPPAVTTTPVDLDGHALNSLPDGTCDELRIDGTGAVTLVQRVGVATAPTAASSWFWGTAGSGIASFTLTDKSTGTQTDMTELMRCDKLPVRKKSGEASYVMVGTTQGHAKNPAITSAATAATVAGGATYLYALATPQEITLPSVSLPALPSPDITVYHDSDVPSDITVEYERDVNIAFDNLAKQIAGTASAVAVREASTIEEE